MYNLHQFARDTQQQEGHLRQRRRKERFLRDREDYKSQAHHALKDRAYEFYRNVQLNSSNPTVLPDQFCQRWQQNGSSKQSTGANRSSLSDHRPALDLQFDRTILSQELMMSSAGFQLQNSLFPSQIRRSQPVHHSKDELKLTDADREWLKPRPLYHTDSVDAVNRSGAEFREKALKLRGQLHHHKAALRSAVDGHLSRYNYTSPEHKHAFTSVIRSVPKPSRVQQSRVVEQPEESCMSMEKSEYDGERGRGRRRERTYFKLAKTMQIQSRGREQMEWSQCLGEWQYDRKKGITTNAVTATDPSLFSPR